LPCTALIVHGKYYSRLLVEILGFVVVISVGMQLEDFLLGFVHSMMIDP